MAHFFVMAAAGGPISQLVGFHVNPLYTSIAALLVGIALVVRLNSGVQEQSESRVSS